MKQLIIGFIYVYATAHINAQGQTFISKTKPSTTFTLSGFGDLYIGMHANAYSKKEAFYYNHKVNNRLRTNLLLVKGELKSKRFHATLGLMTGDYSRFNLAAEPRWAKPLNEAYLGIRLSKNRNIWWDAGVFSSYIGIESAISSDCPTLTRSIVAENSPYYLSGTRIMYVSDNKKHEVGLHVLNGWQRIGWDPDMAKPSFGAHYKHNFNENLALMYGAFYGSIYPDSLSVNRFYQHMNVSWKKGKWETWGTVDLGLESGSLWGAAQIMNRLTFNKHWSLSQRLEVYYDPDNLCARVGSSEETIMGGYSLCPTYLLNNRIAARLETKLLGATESILKGETWDMQFNLGLAVRF